MSAKLIQAEVANIVVPADRLRRVLPDRVAALRESFAEKGHMVPIDLVETDEGPRLIFGAHRIAAIGQKTIMALLHPKGTFGSEAEIRKREIGENFDRFELTVLERAANIDEMRAIHLAEHGPAKRGRKSKQTVDEALEETSANLALNFSDVVQRTLKLSRREVFRALKIASIAPELRDLLAAHSIADNQSELLALADELAKRQAQIVELLTAEPPGATTVAEAIASIDGLPAPVALRPYERLSEGFSRLKPKDRERFFDLHIDDIDRWRAARGK